MTDTTYRLQREREVARSLLASLSDTIGDDEELVASTVEGETSLLEAIDKSLARLVELSGHINALKDTASVMKTRADRFASQQDRIKAAILAAIQEFKLPKTERALATVGTAKVPDKLVISDEEELPDTFWKTPEPVLDRTKLTAAVKDYKVAFERLWPSMLMQHAGNEDAAKVQAAALLATEGKAVPGAHLEPQPNRLNLSWR